METIEKEKSIKDGKAAYLLGININCEYVWLLEASWDCGWYWGFGYIQTPMEFRHFDTLFLQGEDIKGFTDYFKATTLTEHEMWKLMELMQSFYTLKDSAACFNRGGCHITTSPVDDILRNKEMEKTINQKMLPAVFGAVYSILTPKWMLK